ncbi:MAG: ABC transporter permease subunit, partial [Planctomycetales bacterium]|nr:ABC transporter permease subunit [Planctomycetales bacterium]NIM07764.1 ABC transporter permease subunit [Planctomycetales bacterium]NIN07258.1 ABC transporter permease subunit [Planctomycetales bacterium]NIN76350.1 ABC transporter permease subunit [Planctomycetales bacterium]NIO33559.1 ABC transporter permease subunit [Planctomycetales bacterium]
MMDKPADNPHPAAVPSRDHYARLLQEAAAIQGISLWKDASRRLRKNWAAMASILLLTLVGLISWLVPFLPLQSPKHQDLQRQYMGPTWQSVSLQLGDVRDPDAWSLRVNQLWHKPGWFDTWLIHLRLQLFDDHCIPSICGTDNLGRDLLSRIVWGSRVSLLVGIVATLVSLVIGVTYGATAGYLGGWVDTAMMRLVDVLYSVPFIFVVIFLITVLNQEDIKRELARYGIDKIVIFFFVIGAIYWLTMARIVRGQVISLKNEQFIEAARTIGAGRARIIFRHLVPNLLSVVIVYLTLTIPSVMLFEAFLSFLGLGVEPPDVSWGMLA